MGEQPRTQHVGPPPDLPAWRSATAIVARLRNAGQSAYLVGGCVRDWLLDRPADDVDVCTAAHPEAVEALFAQTHAVGKAFGVIIVVEQGVAVEVATFRNDGLYVDGRRPDHVVFSDECSDVERRDFTCNALLYDPTSQQIVDHVGGLADLQDRQLRCVGDPTRRLAEDRLRILRALRFAALLDLHIDDATWTALRHGSLSDLSRERVLQEWCKAIGSPAAAEWVALLVASGHAEAVCPFLGGEPTALIAALRRCRPQDGTELRLALCCRSASPAAARAWWRAEPASREQRELVPWLLEHRPARYAAASSQERLTIAADERSQWLTSWWRLDHPEYPERPALVLDLDRRRQAVCEPWVSARDLLSHGWRPGPALGEELRRLQAAQADGHFPDRTAALAAIGPAPSS